MAKTIPLPAPNETHEQYGKRLNEFMNKYYNKIPVPLKKKK